MAQQARVTSLDALEAFRAQLILFLHKAHARLAEVEDEIRKTRVWLQSEQRLYWEGEIRRRDRALAQAQQELMSAKLSSLRQNIAPEQMAVRRAKEALAEAEQKLRNVKLWTRNFESVFEPLTRKLETLRSVFEFDLPKALTFIAQAQQTLDSYVEAAPSRPADNPTEREEQNA